MCHVMCVSASCVTLCVMVLCGVAMLLGGVGCGAFDLAAILWDVVGWLDVVGWMDVVDCCWVVGCC